MTLSLDGAIRRVNALGLACTTISPRIKKADNYPTEDASMLPMMVTLCTNGTGQADDATISRELLNISCTVHFSRDNLTAAYTQANLFIVEFLRRLAGDPTLNGTCDAIDYPVNVAAVPQEYNLVPTVAYEFTIPIKLRLVPLT